MVSPAGDHHFRVHAPDQAFAALRTAARLSVTDRKILTAMQAQMTQQLNYITPEP